MSDSAMTGSFANLDTSEYDQLIRAIYQGPLEAKPWSNFLHLVSDKLPGAIASLIFQAPREGETGFIRHIDDSHEWARHYDERFAGIDPFVGLPEDKVISIWDFVGEASLKASEYYAGFMEPLSVSDVIGFDIRTEAGIAISFRLCLLDEKGLRFSKVEKELLSLISGHLPLAASLHMELLKGRSMLAFMQQHLESLDVAAFAIENTGNILMCNAAAMPFTRQTDCFADKNDRLEFKTNSEQKEFKQLIDQSVGHYRTKGLCEAFGMVVQSEQLGPITVIIKPIPETLENTYARPALFLMMYNHQRELVISHRLLKDIYRLTAAECKILDLVIQGEDIKEAANMLGITVNTARSHVKSIYAKTGINRQIDLINLVWRTVI